MAIAPTTAPTRTSRLRAPSLPTLGVAAGFLIVLICVLNTHGFWWGQSQPMVQTILDSGAIKCLHDEGLSGLTAKCTGIGQPIGFTIITGMPETMVGVALSYLPGVDAWTAHQVLNVLLDALALWGGYRLLVRWNVPRGFALVGAGTYLITPSLIGINGFQYTFTGYTFLPLYLWLLFVSLDRFCAGRTKAAVAIMFGNVWLMVFTDGYSYATALLLIGVCGLWWLWRDRETAWRTKFIAIGAFVVANATALAAYTGYINAPANPHSGLDQFRYYGLDLVTLFVPVSRLFWPSHVGYTPPNLNLYGDGGQNLFNYMGLIMLGLLVWFVATRQIRKQSTGFRREFVPFVIGSLIALYFSLGPGLKFYTQVDPNVPAGTVPASSTRFPLPLNGLLDAHFPPFDAMRADFRWSIAFRLLVVFGATVALGALWRSGKRTISVILMVLAVLDVAPPPRFQIHFNQQYARWIKIDRTRVFAEFAALTHPGERVLMMPSGNDFIANAMAPEARVKTYNVGIDKNYAASRAAWPDDVEAAVAGVVRPGEPDRIATVLHHDANAVMISYVSLLAAGTYWPAPQPDLPDVKALVAKLAADPRFTVSQGAEMAIVRLRG